MWRVCPVLIKKNTRWNRYRTYTHSTNTHMRRPPVPPSHSQSKCFRQTNTINAQYWNSCLPRNKWIVWFQSTHTYTRSHSRTGTDRQHVTIQYALCFSHATNGISNIYTEQFYNLWNTLNILWSTTDKQTKHGIFPKTTRHFPVLFILPKCRLVDLLMWVLLIWFNIFRFCNCYFFC